MAGFRHVEVELRDGLYTAKEAAERFNVTRNAVLNWSKRGLTNQDGTTTKLPIRGRTETGAALFLWSELVEFERAARMKKQRCRRRPLVIA